MRLNWLFRERSSVGAVLVKDDKVISRSHNQSIAKMILWTINECA